MNISFTCESSLFAGVFLVAATAYCADTETATVEATPTDLHTASVLKLDAANSSVPPTIIPLKEIWALDMPGTKDVRKLDLEPLKVPLTYLQTGPLGVLERMNKHHAEKAFVVEGTGQVALSAAHQQLPAGKGPKNRYVKGSELSIVFFSHGLGRSCELQKVEREANTFSIAYRLYPRGTENVTAHFALIPLGELPVGKYRVRVDEVPLDKKLGIPPLRNIDTRKSICRPFLFSVVNEL